MFKVISKLNGKTVAGTNYSSLDIALLAVKTEVLNGYEAEIVDMDASNLHPVFQGILKRFGQA